MRETKIIAINLIESDIIGAKLSKYSNWKQEFEIVCTYSTVAYIHAFIYTVYLSYNFY